MVSRRPAPSEFTSQQIVGTAPPHAPRLLVVAAFAAVYLLWGSTYLGIRVAIGSIPPLLMAGSRFLLAGAVLYAVMRFRREPAPAVVHWRSALITGLLLLLVGNGGVSLAERTVSTGFTALMIAITPLWMIFIEWLFSRTQRPKWTVFAGLLCGFGGVALLVLSRDVAGHKIVQPAGAALLMLASFCWAAGSIYSRRAPQPRNALLAVAMQMLAGGLSLVIAGVLSGELMRLDFSRITTASTEAFFYLTLFGSLIGYSAYVWLLKVSTPAHVSTYAFVNPFVAVLLGWWFLGEPLSNLVLLSGALIIGAVMLITMRRFG